MAPVSRLGALDSNLSDLHSIVDCLDLSIILRACQEVRLNRLGFKTNMAAASCAKHVSAV